MIVQNGDPVLRKAAEPVAEDEFGTPALYALIDQMAQALAGEEDDVSIGVALAAPQIGVSKRIFVVRYDRMEESYTRGDESDVRLGVFINPRIVKTSRKKAPNYEGCLSVRHFFGKTMRYERATVRARDAEGREFERGGGGLLATVFQHEIDHLDGLLFIDHAEDVHLLERESERKRNA